MADEHHEHEVDVEAYDYVGARHYLAIAAVIAIAFVAAIIRLLAQTG